jgi:hypothetical protein
VQPLLIRNHEKKTTALAILLAKYGSLTPADTERLKELESVIERGRKTFVEVGYTLAEIRAGRLYRQTHATFEAYCAEQWGWTRQRSYQLMNAATVVRLLPPGMSTRVDNEATARELAKLEPKARDKVLQAIEQRGERVTPAAIRAVVKEEKLAPSEPDGDNNGAQAPHHGIQSAASWWTSTSPKNRGYFLRWLIDHEPCPVDVQHSKADVWESLRVWFEKAVVETKARQFAKTKARLDRLRTRGTPSE